MCIRDSDSQVEMLEREKAVLTKENEILLAEVLAFRKRIQNVAEQLCLRLEAEGISTYLSAGIATEHSFSAIVSSNRTADSCIRAVESNFESINKENDGRYSLSAQPDRPARSVLQTVPGRPLNFLIRLK